MEKSTVEKLCRDTRLAVNNEETEYIMSRLDSFCRLCNIHPHMGNCETVTQSKNLDNLRSDSKESFENAVIIRAAFPESEDGLVSAPQSFEGGEK